MTNEQMQEANINIKNQRFTNENKRISGPGPAVKKIEEEQNPNEKTSRTWTFSCPGT
jgi:hypothetical protein